MATAVVAHANPLFAVQVSKSVFFTKSKWLDYNNCKEAADTQVDEVEKLADMHGNERERKHAEAAALFSRGYLIADHLKSLETRKKIYE